METDRFVGTLADACERIDYGLTASAEDDARAPRFLRITDIVSGSIDWSEVPGVNVPLREFTKYKLEPGDIVLARTGASTGASAYVKQPPDAVFASYLVRLRTRPGFDSRYVSYWMKGAQFREYIAGVLGDKSAQPNASAKTMTQAPFSAPPLNEQRRIAHILGTLDDKIELNRRMSVTLEEMARALFKSWFVDFDPVQAKAAGRDTGLPAHISDLFPDRLVDSDLGMIPEGWTPSKLGVEFDVTMGQSPPGDTYNETGEGLAFYQGRSDFGARFPRRRVFCTAPTRIAEAGDTLISVRAPVGDANVARERCAIGRGVAAVRSTEGQREFVYQQVRALSEELAAFNSEGTVFGSINGVRLRGLDVPRVPTDLRIEFESSAGSVGRRLEVLDAESAELAGVRDALLSELI